MFCKVNPSFSVLLCLLKEFHFCCFLSCFLFPCHPIRFHTSTFAHADHDQLHQTQAEHLPAWQVGLSFLCWSFQSHVVICNPSSNQLELLLHVILSCNLRWFLFNVACNMMLQSLSVFQGLCKHQLSSHISRPDMEIPGWATMASL